MFFKVLVKTVFEYMVRLLLYVWVLKIKVILKQKNFICFKLIFN